MRLAVLPAQNAAGAVLRAVTGGIADSRRCYLDGEFEIPTRAAAKSPVAATVRPELVAPEEKREADLSNLQAAELDTSCGLPLACAWPAVAGRRCAAPGSGLEQVPDERFARARIDTLYRNAEPAAPARHGTLRAGRGERLDDCFNDLLAAAIRGKRNWFARPRVHDSALARDHRNRTKGAVVLRRLGIDQVGQCHYNCRAGVRVSGVDEAVHLLVAVSQVDFEIAAALGHLRADMDVLEPVAVIIDHGLAVVHSVRPAADHSAHLALRAIEHRFDCCVGVRRAKFSKQRVEAPLADPR